jgi:hypothetical protein
MRCDERADPAVPPVQIRSCAPAYWEAITERERISRLHGYLINLNGGKNGNLGEILHSFSTFLLSLYINIHDLVSHLQNQMFAVPFLGACKCSFMQATTTHEMLQTQGGDKTNHFARR